MERRTYHPSSSVQQALCVMLMRKAELPLSTVTVMHRDLFKGADIEWRDGQGMSEALAGTDMKRIQLLINALRRRVDEEETDDDR